MSDNKFQIQGNTIKSGHSVVSVFNSHLEAEEAVKNLQKAGFDMTKLSIIGKDYQAEEHVVDYYNVGDRMGYWGKLGAFWGGFWGFLFGSAFFMVPGIGPIVVGGPLVGWIIGALEEAAVIGGIGAIAAALYSIGIPKDSVLRYESSIKSNKFLVIVHGTTGEIAQARDILHGARAVETNVHRAGRVTPIDASRQLVFLGGQRFPLCFSTNDDYEIKK